MEEPDGADAQDIAEVFDEDNLDGDARRFARADEELNFDDMPDVYDATRAKGDEDDEEGLIGEDLDDADLVELVSSERDESDEEDEEDFHSAAGVSDEDEDEEAEPEEVGLTYAGDLNTAPGAHSAAQRYESRTLSDDDLEELGYADGAPARSTPSGASAPGEATGERRSFKADEEAHEAEDKRLDEGVEETFPASDPVSVKHIT